MADVFPPEKRSWIMSRVHGRDTKPEMIVRSMIHRMGYRYRLHRRDLPGSPDVVLSRHKKIIFVHGCFWHGHEGCRAARRPSTNTEFWNKKLDRNIERDARQRNELLASGWKVLTIWECETKNPEALIEKLTDFLRDEPSGDDSG